METYPKSVKNPTLHTTCILVVSDECIILPEDREINMYYQLGVY